MDVVDHRFEILGRGHAERLVPMIAELPEKGRAERIRVSLGPGSFTGVRIGIAAARALAIAWGAEILGYPTLSLIAAQGWQPRLRPISVCMEGGHSQWFVQNFDEQRKPEGPVRSLPHAEAVDFARHPTIVGNRAKALVELTGDDRIAVELLPDARHVPLLRDDAFTENLAPIYGRAPDARPAAVR